MAESLVHEDVLFDETMYKNIDTADKALSYIRYYSQNVGRFRVQLMDRGWSAEDTNKLIDMLWKRVIKGCYKFGIPLTKEAQLNAQRLGL